ncbi:MAG TPA: DUF4397 domain-containing protein [Thermodesulfobacteriota bacterium]|nr:DUF4397 domain-containing protein [Thermodesulfobacteriota bacterium]
MRTVVRIVLILSLLAAVVSCSLFDTRAQVRFENLTSDIVVYYGIGFGDARYNGSFSPGQITDYLRTEEGTYYVELKTSGGSWVVNSTGTATVVNSHKYTIYMIGSYTGGYGYSISQDE